MLITYPNGTQARPYRKFVLTSALKGRITKTRKAVDADYPLGSYTEAERAQNLTGRVRAILEAIMPREQAKHAARKYINR